MSFRSAQVARMWWGNLPLACYARNVAADSQIGMLDTTVLCQPAASGRTFIPDVETGTFTAAGPLDVVGANEQVTAFNALKSATAATPFSYFPTGTDTPGWVGLALKTQYDTTSAPGSTVDYSIAAQADGMLDYNAVVLQDGAVTADGSSSNTDNGAATSAGGVAHLHVSAFSGFTTDDIIIEGSANGSTGWSTVVTFTQVTGVGSERVVITGSVPRYLRVTHNVATTGSITVLVAFSRR
jgi:hypothetical protein